VLAEKLTLPEPVTRIVEGFVEETRRVLGDELKAIVLYGSAAEGKLRKTSDVNVIVVLTAFEPQKVNQLREPLRTAHAAIELEAMFLLDHEIPFAVEAFAVKFADILHRRHVLYGADPFLNIAPSRTAELARLKQELLNLILRLRQGYLLRSLRDEQTVPLIAEAAAPLRACAAAFLELQGQTAVSQKQALADVGASLQLPDSQQLLAAISEARETGTLPPEVGPRTLLGLIELAVELHRRVVGLS
jgi:predicted nucleotidyltransferase